MRVLGIDPGLRRTGWGVIEAHGNRLAHLANGTILTDDTLDLARRLVMLQQGLAEVVAAWTPDSAAVEETLANVNPASTLKLGMARGICLLVPALAGIAVAQYLPMIVKKAVVGTGHAEKAQVAMMVGRLLPGVVLQSADAADALAIAICHSHMAQTNAVWQANASKLGAAPGITPSQPSPLEGEGFGSPSPSRGEGRGGGGATGAPRRQAARNAAP